MAGADVLRCGKTWLCQMGFRRTDEGWIAEEVSLMALDRTEYRILQRL